MERMISYGSRTGGVVFAADVARSRRPYGPTHGDGTTRAGTAAAPVDGAGHVLCQSSQVSLGEQAGSANRSV